MLRIKRPLQVAKILGDIQEYSPRAGGGGPKAGILGYHIKCPPQFPMNGRFQINHSGILLQASQAVGLDVKGKGVAFYHNFSHGAAHGAANSRLPDSEGGVLLGVVFQIRQNGNLKIADQIPGKRLLDAVQDNCFRSALRNRRNPEFQNSSSSWNHCQRIIIRCRNFLHVRPCQIAKADQLFRSSDQLRVYLANCGDFIRAVGECCGPNPPVA